MTVECCLLNPMAQLLLHLVLIISELCINSTTASLSCNGDNLEQNIEDLQNLTSCLSKKILIIQPAFHFETHFRK